MPDPPPALENLSLLSSHRSKRLWQPQGLETLVIFEYLDCPAYNQQLAVPGKGSRLALLDAFLFEKLQSARTWAALPHSPALSTLASSWLDRRWSHLTFSHLLSEHGLPTHYRHLIDGTGRHIACKQQFWQQKLFVEARRAACPVVRPYSIGSEQVYFYDSATSNGVMRLIPLEVIVYFGLCQRNSFSERLQADRSYAQLLGLRRRPEIGKCFEYPVLEFFASTEAERRLLSLQEALLISSLPPGQFEELIETAYMISLFLFAMYSQSLIDLWAARLEFAVDRKGLVLIGSINPDEQVISFAGTVLPTELAVAGLTRALAEGTLEQFGEHLSAEALELLYDSLSSAIFGNEANTPENLRSLCQLFSPTSA